MNNILKSSEFIEKTDYQRISNQLNFEDIWRGVICGVRKYRFFDISIVDGFISFKPNSDYFQLESLSKLSKILNEDMNLLLLTMNEERVFKIKHKKKIMCYLHLDWILSVQHLKDLRENNCDNNELIEYLQFETGNKDIYKVLFHNNGSSEKRSNIYTTNQDSVIIDINNQELCRNTQKLTHQNYNLILSNPLVSLIEISKGFDNIKLNEFLRFMNIVCNKVIKIKEVSEKMKFSLKLRKIKRTNKKGMYIVNQNSILIYPRHVDSFVHELGH